MCQQLYLTLIKKRHKFAAYVSHIVGDGMFAVTYGQFLCEYHGSVAKGFGLNPLPESGGAMDWLAWLQNSGFVVPLDLLALVSLSIIFMMVVDTPSAKVKSTVSRRGVMETDHSLASAKRD